MPLAEQDLIMVQPYLLKLWAKVTLLFQGEKGNSPEVGTVNQIAGYVWTNMDKNFEICFFSIYKLYPNE